MWYTAPTAIRMLMKAGADVAPAACASRPALPRKRRTSRSTRKRSCGALMPSAAPFHDNWWQTETGGIMIANFAAMEVRPGSMGRPLPGIEAAIVQSYRSRRARRGRDTRHGRANWRYGPAGRRCFAATCLRRSAIANASLGGYYLTGDLAKRDRDGYYWFIGRADDVIKSSGHLIGPFEVESVLLEHPAVAEAGVIGKPDPVALEVVKAFVALKPGFEPSDALLRELLGFARVRLGAAVAPKEIAFRPSHSKKPRRQDHAPAAQGARAGTPGRRHLHLGADMSADPIAAPSPQDKPSPHTSPQPARASVSSAPRDAAHPTLRGEMRRTVQRGRRFAAFCISISAKKPSPSAPSTHYAQTMPSWPLTGNMATRSPRASRPIG